MRAHRFAAVDEVSDQIFEEVFFDDQHAAQRPTKRNRPRTRLLNFAHYIRDDATAGNAAFVVEQPPAAETTAAQSAKTRKDKAESGFGYLVIVDGPGEGVELRLSKSVTTLGRAADQDVSLHYGDPYISRNAHARIHFKQATGLIALQSGEKNNPVLLNRRVLHGTQLLRDSDLITLGQTTLRFVALPQVD
jgi:hypothetical protein